MKKKMGSDKKDNKKLFAWLATFFSLLGFIIALIVKRKDKYVMYYAKQSLIIFILGIIVGFIKDVFNLIPFTGKLVNSILGILMFILWLISWINALSGKEKEIPIISYWAEKINL